MLNILSFAFPVSVWTFVIGVTSGLLITLLTLGIGSIIIFLILVYSGILRITPILQFIDKFIKEFFPEFEKKTINNINNLFEITELDNKTVKEGIFCFHPHGSFSVSYFFHTLTNLTKNPIKGRATVTNLWYWLPWAPEILNLMNAIPNHYNAMQEVLNNGENLFILPGGVKEMIIKSNSKVIRAVVKERRGIFRLSLETGKSIIPIISYGEEELYELADIPGKEYIEKKIGLGIPIPSFKTVFNCLFFSKQIPVKSIIGNPILVTKKKNITDEDINNLREKYIKTLEELFEKTKPYGYSLEIL